MVKLRLEAAAMTPGAAAKVVAKVEVAEHWHMNSNQPTLDFLIPTELNLELPAGSSGLEVTYPAHKMLKFPYTEEPIAIYDGRFDVVAAFRLAKDATTRPADREGGARLPGLRRQAVPAAERGRSQRHRHRGGGPGGSPPGARHHRRRSPAGRHRRRSRAARHRAARRRGAGHRRHRAAAQARLVRRGCRSGWPVAVADPAVRDPRRRHPQPDALRFAGAFAQDLRAGESAGQGRAHLVAGALATTFGVLFSFWLLAGAAVLAGWAGAAVGWGVQFQQPGFVAFLAVVVVLFRSTCGVSSRSRCRESLARLGTSGPRQGMAGHFFSGLFATLMATPLLGALPRHRDRLRARPAGADRFPGFLRGRPRPRPALPAAGGLPADRQIAAQAGRLDARLPQRDGFPAGGRRHLALLRAGRPGERRAGRLHPAGPLAARPHHLLPARRRPRLGAQGVALAGMVAASALTVVLAAPGAAQAVGNVAGKGDHLEWVAFDEQEAQKLAAGGRPVFVDFTADWCLTCKVNERVVIDTPEIAAAFARYEVVAMRGDWTSRDDKITAFLKRYGRSAVPFYVLFRPGRRAAPVRRGADPGHPDRRARGGGAENRATRGAMMRLARRRGRLLALALPLLLPAGSAGAEPAAPAKAAPANAREGGAGEGGALDLPRLPRRAADLQSEDPGLRQEGERRRACATGCRRATPASPRSRLPAPGARPLRLDVVADLSGRQSEERTFFEPDTGRALQRTKVKLGSDPYRKSYRFGERRARMDPQRAEQQRRNRTRRAGLEQDRKPVGAVPEGHQCRTYSEPALLLYLVAAHDWDQPETASSFCMFANNRWNRVEAGFAGTACLPRHLPEKRPGAENHRSAGDRDQGHRRQPRRQGRRPLRADGPARRPRDLPRSRQRPAARHPRRNALAGRGHGAPRKGGDARIARKSPPPLPPGRRG